SPTSRLGEKRSQSWSYGRCFHDQIVAEFPVIKTVFGEVRPQHNNVTLTSMAIGSMPNPGLFFVRGDYITNYNEACFLHLISILRQGNTSFDRSGGQPFLSYAHFEHDRRYLTLFFAQYRNGIRPVVNMEQCKEWVRVLKWPGDVRSSGCSSEALADCQFLRATFPKRNEDEDEPTYQLFSIISRLMQRSSSRIYFGSVFTTRRGLPPEVSVKDVGSFRADYAAKALVSRGCTVSDQLLLDECKRGADGELMDSHLFFERVRWCMKECTRACEEALENLLCAIDERRTVELLRAFHQMYTVRVNAIKRCQRGDVRVLKKSLPRNCVLVRKVMVTPLKTLFMAPEVMMTNRVVRRFGEENALRCVFRDDSGAHVMTVTFHKQSSIVANIVQKTLSHGLQINNRHYHFLAWSNSQMRDHGCYMYAPTLNCRTGDVSMTVEDMRKWMGDFSGTKNVPKLMSRMGQCFTQAQPTVTILPGECSVEDDVEGGAGHPETRESYCFSDGCGRVAPSLARRIALALQLDIVPSCYQVRFKGFKGVLAIDPSLDLMKNGPKIVFRKSQMKFKERCDEQENNILEVVKYSMPSAVCLNRPLITILDQVTEKQSKWLHKKLCAKVHYYLETEFVVLMFFFPMLLDDSVAADELTLRLNLPINFVRLRECGICITNEPFLRRILVSVYRYNINNHLSKAKIFLPPSLGRSMYGVFDETGLLQYGQVFIQYSVSVKKADGKLRIYTGPVMITKNPCHVAGDVRMFTAVYQPALAHLFDVVVFPRHGPRPHPDEMAGSDLDGDEYSVIFDPDIYFDHNEEAMTFPKSSPDDFDMTDDMVDFFLKYLRQDSIGRMSNAHLILADRKGLFDEVCNEIARKCAIAVDFPKSGEPAEPLTAHEQSDVVPDYMFSVVKPMYRSRRLNGQLYRKAKKVEEVLDMCELSTSVFEHDVLCPSGFDPFGGNDSERANVRRIRDEYAARIQQLLDEYGVCDEASIVSGHIVSLKRLATMEKDDYSFYHTDKIVELRYTKIYHQYRAYFFEEFGGESAVYQRDPSGKFSLRCDENMEMKALQWFVHLEEKWPISIMVVCHIYCAGKIEQKHCLGRWTDFQEWTGVSQILTRSMYQNRRNDVILITSVGTATARQRLSRLLLLPVDQLRRAIRDQIMPLSARDETL
uniref:RNA-dependent RNA polymerase n=1 Tax=Angiostrongylus cantonensis TaxID=6313 RepID=A0A0K0DD89_ANGCA